MALNEFERKPTAAERVYYDRLRADGRDFAAPPPESERAYYQRLRAWVRANPDDPKAPPVLAALDKYAAARSTIDELEHEIAGEPGAADDVGAYPGETLPHDDIHDAPAEA